MVIEVRLWAAQSMLSDAQRPSLGGPVGATLGYPLLDCADFLGRHGIKVRGHAGLQGAIGRVVQVGTKGWLASQRQHQVRVRTVAEGDEFPSAYLHFDESVSRDASPEGAVGNHIGVWPADRLVKDFDDVIKVHDALSSRSLWLI